MKNEINNNELMDDELKAVTGGARETYNNTVERMCPKCQKVTIFNSVSGGRAFCRECGTQIII